MRSVKFGSQIDGRRKIWFLNRLKSQSRKNLLVFTDFTVLNLTIAESGLLLITALKDLKALLLNEIISKFYFISSCAGYSALVINN